ncbi:glycerophosphodiester phosphodiesterase [Neobacillus sp. SM06]|uniref:glycerophosphodiester phosphodiesterase n=1 Tax=Neobacillus sp. SM06 TaxID=3422492 RepID=UPI003D2A8715
MRRPFITAHTGCENTRPNSIQSVLEGIHAGAEIIEVDVRSTKDGTAVLFHDEVVDTVIGKKRIQELTLEELNQIAADKEIVRLEEVLPIIRENHRIINLDLKEDHAIDPMIQAVERYHMRDQSLISGCEKDRAFYLKERYRSYQVLLNASVKRSDTGNEELFIKETCDDAIAASCCGININYHYCKDKLVEYASLRCLPVLVWTVDDADQMKKFLNLNVQSITSHEVNTLCDLRDKSGEWR